MTLASTMQGLHNAAVRSQDFQWSGTHVLLQHVDPWAAYLQGDPGHLFVLTQVPNYVAELYILFVPLGLLPLAVAKLVWGVCNVVFSVMIGALAGRFYGFRERGVVVVVCMMLLATPTRMCIGNGQQTLLVLLLWCLSLLKTEVDAPRSVAVGLSYSKFNFAPPVFLYLWFRSGWKAVFLSLLPSAVATLAVSVWLTRGVSVGELKKLLLEPLAVSKIGYLPRIGSPNLMDVVEAVLARMHVGDNAISLITLGIALAVTLLLLYWMMRVHAGSSLQWQMAMLGVISIALYKHHFYDAVVMLLPLCYLLRLYRDRWAQVGLGLIAYLWYLQRLVDAVNPSIPGLFVVQFAMFAAVLVIIYRLREAGETSYGVEQESGRRAR